MPVITPLPPLLSLLHVQTAEKKAFAGRLAVRLAKEREIETYYRIRKEIEAENAEFSEPSLTT